MASLGNALKRLEAAKFLSRVSNSSTYKLGPNGRKARTMLARRMEAATSPQVISREVDSMAQVQPVLDEASRLLKEDTMLNVRLRGRLEDEDKFDVRLGGDDEMTFEIVSSDASEHKMFSFFLADKWKFVLADLTQTRRRFWKRLLHNPWTVEVARSNITTERPSSEIYFNFEEEKQFRLLMESSRVKGLDEVSLTSGIERLKMVETNSRLSSGCFALLLDSVRKRQHLASTRLALHKWIAPFQTAFIIQSTGPSGPSKKLCDLRELLVGLALEKDIEVNEEVKSFEAADDLGIPYVVVIDEQSLDRGVVMIRDRETCWFEEIHAAHLTKRLVHIFKGEIIPDTWEEIKAEDIRGRQRSEGILKFK